MLFVFVHYSFFAEKQVIIDIFEEFSEIGFMLR